MAKAMQMCKNEQKFAKKKVSEANTGGRNQHTQSGNFIILHLFSMRSDQEEKNIYQAQTTKDFQVITDQ